MNSHKPALNVSVKTEQLYRTGKQCTMNGLSRTGMSAVAEFKQEGNVSNFRIAQDLLLPVLVAGSTS